MTTSYLNIKIKGIRNIDEADLTWPFMNGIYTFVGANGSGKSTILQCLAQLVVPRKGLKSLAMYDFREDTSIEFNLGEKYLKYTFDHLSSSWVSSGEELRFNGLYEGSLFYGTRFEDSTKIEQLILRNKISDQDIVDADEEVKDKMSYILHGDYAHYRSLKRIRNKQTAEKLGVQNRPYFIEVQGGLISQYKMSSGECLLVSLLHFLYNSIVRRSLPAAREVLVLIDELELALHPSAIFRLIEYLSELVDSHSNLIIYLSSHSPDVIRKVSPHSLFRVENKLGKVSIEDNCYPSYLIRDLSSPVSPDYLLLVEDRLAQVFVESILVQEKLRMSKLVQCIPVGGWKNVLDLHKEIFTKKVLGISAKIVSILDGDIETQMTKSDKKFPHLFLPIPSVEKFMYKVAVEGSYPEVKRQINDTFFIVRSLDEIVSEYNRDPARKQGDKSFYRYIISELDAIDTKEEVFVDGLVKIISEQLDVSKFIENLRKHLCR